MALLHANPLLQPNPLGDGGPRLGDYVFGPRLGGALGDSGAIAAAVFGARGAGPGLDASGGLLQGLAFGPRASAPGLDGASLQLGGDAFAPRRCCGVFDDAAAAAVVAQVFGKRNYWTPNLSGALYLDQIADGQFLKRVGNAIVGSAAAGGGVAYTEIIQDLGAGERSGTFDITGLSGLTAGKPVHVFRSAAAVPSKGDARDEADMDSIVAAGYVVSATTIRVYWHASGVIVGDTAFAYVVSN